MKKLVSLKILATILLVATVGFVLFLSQNGYSAGPRCRIAKVGQVPKRLLELQQELIFLIGYSIEKYSQLTTHALTTAHFVSQCDIKKCQEGGCQESEGGLGISCAWGDECSEPSSGDDICPEDAREGMGREYDKAEKIANQDLMFKVGDTGIGLIAKLGVVAAEIASLKDSLGNAPGIIESWDPKTELLLSCKEARDMGYIQSCTKKHFEIFGIPVPYWLVLGDEPDSNIDYFVCEKKKIQ